MESNKLTADQARVISTALISFESLNVQRQLVDSLISQGVTLATYREWVALDEVVELGVSKPLRIDVENMFSHLEKGINVRADTLNRMTNYRIKKAAERAAIAQQKILDKFK